MGMVAGVRIGPVYLTHLPPLSSRRGGSPLGSQFPRPVLQRLRDVGRRHLPLACQIRDRARQFQYPVIRPRAEFHLAHGRAQQLPGCFIDKAKISHLRRPHIRVGG